jgi:hypothetical protein
MDPTELTNIIESGRVQGTDTLFTFHIIRPDNYRYIFQIKVGDLYDSGSYMQSLTLNQGEIFFNEPEELPEV